jgi:hypothetical protein
MSSHFLHLLSPTQAVSQAAKPQPAVSQTRWVYPGSNLPGFLTNWLLTFVQQFTRQSVGLFTTHFTMLPPRAILRQFPAFSQFLFVIGM